VTIVTVGAGGLRIRSYGPQRGQKAERRGVRYYAEGWARLREGAKQEEGCFSSSFDPSPNREWRD
jgi:hypothetical protein